jgi:hypothetical protein
MLTQQQIMAVATQKPTNERIIRTYLPTTPRNIMKQNSKSPCKKELIKISFPDTAISFQYNTSPDFSTTFPLKNRRKFKISQIWGSTVSSVLLYTVVLLSHLESLCNLVIEKSLCLKRPSVHIYSFEVVKIIPQ